MRVLLLINATLDKECEREIAAGRYPRKDYLELQRAMDADIVDLGILERRLWTRQARRFVGAAFAQALLAWLWSARYDAIFADRESSGFALAALLKLRRRRPRLTMIGHLLSSPMKQRVFGFLRLRRQIDQMIVHSSLQQRLAEQELGLRPEQVSLVPYQTDEQFWAPCETPIKNQICSAGLEYRDYTTLFEASIETGVDVVIAAASHWSKHKGVDGTQTLPPNVHVQSLDYAALRRLYAESLFVVVPLHDVENQAGITTILEAMAMGKAVIVSHTRGQTDVVRDRRHRSRADQSRATQPEWARMLGASPETAEGYTGIYVRPGDADELRRAITFLVEHPEQARAMGANGRRLIEETMGLDHFTARVVALVTGTHLAPVGQSVSHDSHGGGAPAQQDAIVIEAIY